jgi:pyruvate/2-oxoglutarate dehydrogenase complex dihydrolipoamide acyltransferase (E2) component
MKKEQRGKGCSIRPISRKHQLIDDYTTVAKSRNIIWGATKVDITEVRQKMKDWAEKTGEKISLTAYIIGITARVVEKYKYPVNTLRYKKKKFYIFDDVDILTNIERELDGVKKPVNYTVRKANEKTFREINDEIRVAQTKKVVSMSDSGKSAEKILKMMIKAPRFVRKAIIRYIFRHPMLKKKLLGTIGVTAVGMMSKRRGGNGHFNHITPHTLSVGVGGIDINPVSIDGKTEHRELLDISVALDHAIIDGGPATRFLHDLRYALSDEYLEDEWCFKSL